MQLQLHTGVGRQKPCPNRRDHRRHGNVGRIDAQPPEGPALQALDTTIANVSLPYIQGSVAANQDQVD